LRVSWPVYNARPINCERIRSRWRQILHRNFAHDARRIACPITHRGFAGEDRAFFCGRGNYDGDDENRRDDRDVDENAINSSKCHCFGIAFHGRFARLGSAYRAFAFWEAQAASQ